MYTTWYVRIVNSLPIYFQHLETAPKEILGDFPRMSRSEAVTTVYSVEAAHQQNGWAEGAVVLPADNMGPQDRHLSGWDQQQQQGERASHFRGEKKRPAVWASLFVKAL